MPTITIPKTKLLSLIQKQFTDQEIENILFDFGLELESSENNNFKIEVPANRYDLLSLEGLAQALKIYLGLEKISPLQIESHDEMPLCKEKSCPKNKFADKQICKVYKDRNTDRPFIACAIINNINLADKYDSFIDYQEILHQTLGRNRKILSIGTHDADKIKFPVFYKNVDKYKFVPLNADHEIDDLKDHFKNDKKFLKYLEMIDHYSVFIDSTENILSVPPVINSEYSKITRDTKNIFIEVTSHDFNRAKQALNYILYSFRGESVTYCEIIEKDSKENTNTEEKNKCINEDNYKDIIGIVNNNLRIISDSIHNFKFSLSEINSELGLNLKIEEVKKYFERMMHCVEILNENKYSQENKSSAENIIMVTVYGVRSDVLHKCDLIEDLAIAHGYNNFEIEKINISTIGEEDSINKFSNKIRNELAMAGFIEVLTFSLISKRDLNFGDNENVILENPKSNECEFVRNELISSLMKCVQSNQHASLPIKVFEVGDVVLLESNLNGENVKEDAMNSNFKDVEPHVLSDSYNSIYKKALNKRKAGGLIAGKKDSFEEIQGLITHIFLKCNLKVSFVETTIRGFVNKRCGLIICEGEELGYFGIVDLNVCRKMSIPLVCTGFEIDLHKLFDLFMKMN